MQRNDEKIHTYLTRGIKVSMCLAGTQIYPLGT